MSRCNEGYLNKNIADIMGDRSILSVALNVAMIKRGSKDANSASELRDDEYVLRWYISNWTNSRDDFDKAVYNLIEAALALPCWWINGK